LEGLRAKWRDQYVAVRHLSSEGRKLGKEFEELAFDLNERRREYNRTTKEAELNCIRYETSLVSVEHSSANRQKNFTK
jgi:hypothetical protein